MNFRLPLLDTLSPTATLYQLVKAAVFADDSDDEVGPVGLRPKLSHDLVIAGHGGKLLSVSRSQLLHHCWARTLADEQDLICSDLHPRLTPTTCTMAIYDSSEKSIMKLCEFEFFSPDQLVFQTSAACSLLVAPTPVEYYNKCDPHKRTLTFSVGLHKVCLDHCSRLTSPYASIYTQNKDSTPLIQKHTNLTYLFTALAGSNSVASLLNTMLTSRLTHMPAAAFATHDWVQDLIPDLSDAPAAALSLSVTLTLALFYCAIRRCISSCPARSDSMTLAPVTLQAARRRAVLTRGSPLP